MSAKSRDCDRAMGVSEEPKHIQIDWIWLDEEDACFTWWKKKFLCLLPVENSLSQPVVKAINIQPLPGLQPVVAERQEKSPERENETQ